MELLFCFLVAWFFVKDSTVDGWAMAKGQKPPRHTERMARRQQEHERRLAAMQHRSAERIAGVGGPTVGDAFAERIRRGSKSRDDMHGPRAWWFDLSADTAERLTRERREREERRDRGEQEWQKFARSARARYRRAGERAGQRWQERNAPRDPHRRWVDSERADEPAGTGWPDPNAHNPGTGDAQVVDDPQPQPRGRSTPGHPELEPGWPEPESMSCPNCRGSGCETCGGDGHVPSWLADPAINTAAGEWAAVPATENPPGTVRAVAERIPEPLGSTPAGQSTNTQGDTPMISRDGIDHSRLENASLDAAARTQDLQDRYRGGGTTGVVPRQGHPSGGSVGHPQVAVTGALNGETVDPESLGSFAGGMQQVAHAMLGSIEASIANLENQGVSGGPIEDLRAMADAAAILAGRSQSTAQHAASHADIQGVAQSDPTVGGEQYLGIGAGRR